MSLPTVADFILSFLNDSLKFVQLGGAESLADGQFDFRFEPELRFAFWRNHMDVHSRLFPREKIKPIAAIPKNRRTHLRKIAERPVNSTVFLTFEFCSSRREEALIEFRIQNPEFEWSLVTSAATEFRNGGAWRRCL
jgi:hypothetical protein